MNRKITCVLASAAVVLLFGCGKAGDDLRGIKDSGGSTSPSTPNGSKAGNDSGSSTGTSSVASSTKDLTINSPEQLSLELLDILGANMDDSGSGSYLEANGQKLTGPANGILTDAAADSVTTTVSMTIETLAYWVGKNYAAALAAGKPVPDCHVEADDEKVIKALDSAIADSDLQQAGTLSVASCTQDGPEFWARAVFGSYIFLVNNT